MKGSKEIPRQTHTAVHLVFLHFRDGQPGPEAIKLCSCSTQLSMEFILLINVKMPTIVGILTFISMINTATKRLTAKHFFICRYFSYDQLKFCAQLS